MSGINKAIELSEAIELAITEYDFDKVAQLDKERQWVINHYFTEQKHIDEKLTLKLKEMNDSIVARLMQLQKQNQTEQMKAKHASNATRAYLENQPK